MFAFVCVCPRLLAFACVFASAFARVCLRSFAFARISLRPPLLRPPLTEGFLEGGLLWASRHKRVLRINCGPRDGTQGVEPDSGVQRFWGPLAASEFDVCLFSTERGNKVGHSEAPKRSRFPGCPLRGFQPSGSYPRVIDKRKVLRSGS